MTKKLSNHTKYVQLRLSLVVVFINFQNIFLVSEIMKKT